LSLVLGIRCSNTDYTFAVLKGTKKAPGVVVTGTVPYPKGFTKPQSLKWLAQEIDGFLKTHQIEKIVMNRFEGRGLRKLAYEDRVEHEAAVYIAAANSGMKAVFKKVKSTIAKDLGLKGRARYLAAGLDTSLIPDFQTYSDKVRDATLAAWSELS
jgi:hypothetical protein